MFKTIPWQDVCKFLAGASFVNAGVLFYLYLARVSAPLLRTNFIETPEISGNGLDRPCRSFRDLLLPWLHSKVETPFDYDLRSRQREDSRSRRHLDARRAGGGPGNGFESHSGRRDFPFTGSTAAALRSALGQVRIEGKPDIQEIHVAGDYAFCWNQLSVTATPLQGGPAQRRAGPTLSVFRKERDGRWILFRDANMLKTV
jgi:hypothetical protein